MNAVIEATTIEVVSLESETSHPEPIRVIRQGQWVILASETEMSPAERREQYCRLFNIYA